LVSEILTLRGTADGAADDPADDLAPLSLDELRKLLDEREPPPGRTDGLSCAHRVALMDAMQRIR
jgi:hypothetical protein